MRMILYKNESPAFWICAWMAILSSSISAGFSIANVATQGMGDISALYAVSRSLSLLLIALVVAVRRSKLGVATVALIMTLVQLGDTIVGLHIGNTAKTIGPLILALATAITLVLLLGKYNDRHVPGSPEGS